MRAKAILRIPLKKDDIKVLYYDGMFMVEKTLNFDIPDEEFLSKTGYGASNTLHYGLQTMQAQEDLLRNSIIEKVEIDEPGLATDIPWKAHGYRSPDSMRRDLSRTDVIRQFSNDWDGEQKREWLYERDE